MVSTRLGMGVLSPVVVRLVELEDEREALAEQLDAIERDATSVLHAAFARLDHPESATLGAIQERCRLLATTLRNGGAS